VLRRWLAHPLTRGLALDAPETTALRREIVRTKPFLRRIYEEWYRALAASVPPGPGAVLELGSGAGFLREVLPEAITSEVFRTPGAAVVLDARVLPVRAGALRAVVMTDVLHHVPDCRAFFAEATRCVRPGGVVSAIEPWVSAWSSFVYGRLHHEPFRPDAPEWEFPAAGPLSGSNQALPWILFERDRARFEAEFPGWRVEVVRPFMPFRYLASGGVGLRALSPAWSTPAWRGIERLAAPWMRSLAMFAHVVLRRAG
jgi:SAM-dependent methyltransferase